MKSLLNKKVLISWSIEFGPIALFFIALHFLGDTDKGFIVATGIFTLLTACALYVSYREEKRIALFPLVAGISVIVFGICTLIFQNPLFFIIKDTIYNGAFAIALMWGLMNKKSYLKCLFGTLFDITDHGWFLLTRRWCIFFFILTVGNEIAWRVYGQEGWVIYKFWSTIATIVFGFYQLTLSKKHRNDGANPLGMRVLPISLE